MTREDAQYSAGLLEFIDLTPDQARSIDEMCDYFEHQLYVEGRPRIERLLGGFKEPERSVLLRELLLLELETWLLRDSVPQLESYVRRFPGHATLVRDIFAAVFPQVAPPDEPPPDEPKEDQPQVPNYRILRRLGEGGMGRVYEAIHIKLETRVALKVMQENLVSDLEAEARFEREMRIIGTLAHPNIVAARDAGKAEGRHYLVMEYVEGLDLSALLKRLGTLAVADACEITRGIALALQHAEEHRLVHRDIKPKNVLLGCCPPNLNAVQVKVADFGLATLRGYAALRDPSVAYLRVAGTFAYMAPEQFWQQTSDIRSDLYSLGCTLYCLLVGRPPFTRPQYQDWNQVMEAHRGAPVPSLRIVRPDVSEALEQDIWKLMAKDPKQRFQTPAEIAERLASFTVGQDLPGLLRRAEALKDAFAHPPDFPLNALPQKCLPSALEREGDREIVERTPSSELSDTLPWMPSDSPQQDRADKRPATQRPASSPNGLHGAAARKWDGLRSGIEKAAGISLVAKDLFGLFHRGEPTGDRRWRLSPRQWIVMLAVVAGLGSALAWAMWNLPRMARPIDLLALLDLDREAVSGRWTRDGDSLVSPAAGEAKLRLLSAAVPDEYQLEIQTRRISGGRLVLGLVWNGRQVLINLGISVIPSEESAVDGGDPSALAAHFEFRGGPPETYLCIVRRKGYLVAYEDQVLEAVVEDAESPVASDPAALELWTHHSVYRFSRIVLTPRGR